MIEHQDLHQPVLQPGEPDGPSVSAQFTAMGIQRETAIGQHIRLILFPPPEHCPDPGQHLPHIKGFGQIVVCAQVQPLNAHLHLGFCRQKQDGCPAALTAQQLQNLKAIQLRHHNIEDHPVIGFCPGISQGIRTVVHRVHLVIVIG